MVTKNYLKTIFALFFFFLFLLILQTSLVNRQTCANERINDENFLLAIKVTLQSEKW